MMKNSSLLKIRVDKTEKLILDYILEHNCRIRISECAAELGLSFSEVENAIKLLTEKGLLNVFQGSVADTTDLSCKYLKSGRCIAVQDNISLRQQRCRNVMIDACCYLCNYRQYCDIGCDVLEPDNVILEAAKANIRNQLARGCL